MAYKGEAKVTAFEELPLVPVQMVVKYPLFPFKDPSGTYTYI